MRRRNSVNWVLFALLLGLTWTTTPQLLAQELTGTLYGKVVADDGALLPGVTVTITSPQMIKGADVRVTNETGTYRVPALPPGTYAVKVELPGFQTVSKENIQLAAGVLLAIDFKLAVASLAESITVVGESPLVDVRSSQTMRTVDKAALDNVPVGRTFADLIVTAPGVIDSQYSFAPAQTVHGSSVRDNVFNVDGAVANDSTVGYMSTQVPYDVLEEVQITSGGISAEFGQASGAVFNFITKSGGNEFSGGTNVFLQNDSLSSSNLSDDLISQGLRTGAKVTENLEYGGHLGGPIKKNRLWFFGNVRWLTQEQQVPEFPARNPTTEERQGFLKLTALFGSKTTLQGSLTKVNYDQFPSNGTFATNNAPETWSRGLKDQKIIYTNLKHVVTNSTFLDFQFGYTIVDLDSVQELDAVGTQDLVTGLVFGGWTATSGKTFERDKRTFKLNLSHFRDKFLGGSHNLKVGVYNEFSPFARVRDIYGDTLQLVNQLVPFRVRLYDTPRTPRTNVTSYAAYVQDEWTLKNRVTLNLGIRMEATEGWQPQQESGGGRWFPVQSFPEQRDQINWFTVAPRLGVVWDMRGDQKTSLRLSYGRYYEALLNQHVLAANRGQAGFQEYDWIDRNADLAFQAGEQTILRRDVIASLDDFDPNLRQPYVDAVHLGVDQRLGERMVFSVAGIYKRERDILETVDVGLPFSSYNAISVTNPLDGNPFTIYALDPRFQGARNINLLTNPTIPVPLKRGYYGVEMVLRRRMSNRWQFQGSLNLGRSEGNIGNGFDSSSGLATLYNNPNTLINFDGPLDLDTPVQAKFQGTYLAPFDVLLSAYYSGISGFPYHYTVRFNRGTIPQIIVESSVDAFGERRGSHRFDFRHKLSFRAEKQFVVRGSKIGLIADVFNLLNINTVTGFQSLRTDQDNFLRPSAIEAPRAMRLGVRFLF